MAQLAKLARAHSGGGPGGGESRGGAARRVTKPRSREAIAIAEKVLALIQVGGRGFFGCARTPRVHCLACFPRVRLPAALAPGPLAIIQAWGEDFLTLRKSLPLFVETYHQARPSRAVRFPFAHASVAYKVLVFCDVRSTNVTPQSG